MVRFIIATLLSVLLICLLIYVIFKVRLGKEKKVREYYAFKCVSLLIVLAGNTITAIINPYSVWDFLAYFFQFEVEQPAELSIISNILAALIFWLCWRMVNNTYKQWSGPISRRQYRRDISEVNDNSILTDFFAILESFFNKQYDLKEYKHLGENAEYRDSYETSKLAWHIEAARMYMLMENQAKIDIKEDWHIQQHCFISSYADSKKIAIYCVNNIPSPYEITSFLRYIYQLNKEYFRVVVAVREGKRGERDYTENQNGIKIEYIFKQNMLNNLVDFSDYYRQIKELYNKPLMESTLRIEDIFVEPDCRIGNTQQVVSLNTYVSDWLNEKGNRQLALLGDFGQGKTMFSLYLTCQMIEKKFSRIPILISLRNKSPRNSTRAEILSYFAVQYGINPEALLILNANSRLLLIFDGFDEMDLIGNDDIRKRHFKNLWSLVMPESKVLITGRPNYFLNQEEMKSALGFEMGTKELPYCEGLYLLPFDQRQIMLALRNTKETVRNGIQYVVEQNLSPSFLDLISRPSHLFLVGQIWEARELEKKYKNLTSASVINEFLQNCFERQAAKGTQDPYFFLSPIEREYFMIGIAVTMYKLGNTAITHEAFQYTIMDLVDMFPQQLSNANPAFLNLRNGKSVKEFAKQDRDSLIAIVNDVRTCGILVIDNANNGMAFAHKSFFDLLVAKFYLGKYLRSHDSGMIISDALSKVNTFNPRLGNDLVIRKLLAELVCGKIGFVLQEADDDVKCRKIFEQCYKVIARFPLRATPQKLLQTCINNQVIKVRSSRVRKERMYMQYTKLLIFFVLSILASWLYMMRLFTISSGHNMEVVSFIAYSGRLHTLSSNHMFNDVFYMILGGIILFYIFGKKIRSLTGSKADIILLTWYYACIEHHIPESVIFQYISGAYVNAFSTYVKGRNLDNVIEKKK